MLPPVAAGASRRATSATQGRSGARAAAAAGPHRRRRSRGARWTEPGQGARAAEAGTRSYLQQQIETRTLEGSGAQGARGRSEWWNRPLPLLDHLWQVGSQGSRAAEQEDDATMVVSQAGSSTLPESTAAVEGHSSAQAAASPGYEPPHMQSSWWTDQLTEAKVPETGQRAYMGWSTTTFRTPPRTGAQYGGIGVRSALPIPQRLMLPPYSAPGAGAALTRGGLERAQQTPGAAAGAALPPPRTWGTTATQQLRRPEESSASAIAATPPGWEYWSTTATQSEQHGGQETMAQQLARARAEGQRWALQEQAEREQQRRALEEARLEGYLDTHAQQLAEERRAVWQSAPLYTQQEQWERTQRRTPGRNVPNALGVWNNLPVLHDPQECRGVASRYNTEQARFRVERVPSMRHGYCTRSTCECCAPISGAVSGRPQFCSCRAVEDELCKRCWLDKWGSYLVAHNQYWGPTRADFPGPWQQQGGGHP